MTSANLSEEPIAINNDEARARLGQIADAFLMHNRDILQRCDDSVAAIVDALRSSFAAPAAMSRSVSACLSMPRLCWPSAAT